MSNDDPFLDADDTDDSVDTEPQPIDDDGESTVIAPAPELAPSPLPRAATGPLSALRGGAGSNPLVGCASTLLAAVAPLRASRSHPDPKRLRAGLIDEIRGFEGCARAAGYNERVVLPARYVLCSLLDEAVLDTPWGGESVWSAEGLLLAFHNEAWGGEKFFLILDRLIAYPSGNRELLELMYLCLALGFAGRYRARADGRDALESIRERVYQTLRGQRGGGRAELSPHWRGVVEAPRPLVRWQPLVGVVALALGLMLGAFAVYDLLLREQAEPVYLSLQGLGKDLPNFSAPEAAPSDDVLTAPEAPVAQAKPAPPTLRELLASDIRAGTLEVVDRAGGQVVIIHGDGLFASARAEVKPDYEPVLRHVAEALAQLPGKVMVTGYTDSLPIRTRRFPNNEALSLARAESVARFLGEVTGTPDRFQARGLGSADPLVPDDPAAARNRRVEITLLTSATATAADAPFGAVEEAIQP